MQYVYTYIHTCVYNLLYLVYTPEHTLSVILCDEADLS